MHQLAYGEVLNFQAEKVKYAKGVGGGFDNTPTQPHRMPTWVSQTGPAGSCLINWTMLWHTRSPSHGTVDRDLIYMAGLQTPEPGCWSRTAAAPPHCCVDCKGQGWL